MKKIDVCPGTLAVGYDKYSPSCVRNMFGGKQISPFLDFSYDANHEDFVASVLSAHIPQCVFLFL